MRRAALLLGLAACGGGHLGGDDPEADRIACARLQTGPFQALVAAATTADAPGIESGAIAYRVDGAGFVYYGAPAAGDYGIFLDADVDVAVTAGGAPVEPSDSQDGSSACDEVARRIVVPMQVGVHYLELSGAATVVVEPIGAARDS